MSQAIESKLSKAYTTAGGKNVAAIPWAMLLELLMSLFGGGCTAKRAKRFAKMFPEATKRMFDDKLKEDGLITSAKERKLVVESGYKVFCAASDADIESVRN